MKCNDEIMVIAGILFVLFFAGVLIIYVLEFNKRQKRYTNERELMNAQFGQALLKSQLEIQEQTFKNISQEIHDNIGQTLTLVKLNINTLEIEKLHPAHEKLDLAKQGLNKAIQDLRDLSKTLNSDTIPQVGMVEAVKMELGSIEKVTGISTTFECNNNMLELDPQVELILFRVIQESLHNIIKHAKASHIYVSVCCEANQLLLGIQDDGIGFDMVAKSHGSGLLNVKSRCALIHANHTMISAPLEGTKITVSLPLHAASQEV